MVHFATSEDTLKLSRQFNHLKYKLIGTSGLYCSAAGFGGYRIHIGVDEHMTALKYALNSGINLIDTSCNYADGGSEGLIGHVLKDSAMEQYNRNEIIIISKAGYLQGKNYELSQQLKQQGKGFAELVPYSQKLEHCIHPEFLEDQITRSLNRLNIPCIDFFLLHNPEYYLLWAHDKGIPLRDARKEMYRRIENAFLHLEIEVQNGRIRYYGISSNSFPIPANRYDFLELEHIWQLAQKISNDHNFKVIQLPFNLIENGAQSEKNQSSGKSVLEVCKDVKLGVFSNRPLNAFSENQMIRLCSLPNSGNNDDNQISEHFKKLIDLEEEFIDQILGTLNIEQKDQQNLSGLFSSAQYLSNRYKELGPYWQWMEQQARFLADQVSYAVQLVNETADKSNKTVKWLDRYVELFNALFDELTLYYGQMAAEKNDRLFESYKKDYRELKNCKNLQQLAISAIASHKSVSSVLNGMRTTAYVDDAMYCIAMKK